MPDLIRHPASPRLRAEKTVQKESSRATDVAQLYPGSSPG